MLRASLLFRTFSIRLIHSTPCGRCHHSPLFAPSPRSPAAPAVRFASTASLLRNQRLPPIRSWRSMIVSRQSAQSAAKNRAPRGELRRFWGGARREKWTLITACCFLIISSCVTMSVPYAVGRVIDIVASAGDEQLETLKNFVYIFIGVFALGAAANYCRVYSINRAYQRIVADLRRSLVDSIMSKDAAFFKKAENRSGELVNRLSLDCHVVGSALTQNVSDGLRSTLSTCIGASMMFYTSTNLAVVGLCTVPPIAIVGAFYGRRLKRIAARVQDQLAESAQIADERFSNIQTVQYFSQEQSDKRLYYDKIDEVLATQKRQALAEAGFYGFAGLSGNVVILGVLAYGGVLMHQGALSVGQLSSFLLYAALVGVSVSGMSQFYAEMMKGVGSSHRIWKVADEPTTIRSGALRPKSIRGGIELRDVSFKYDENSPALRNVSLSIGPGEHVAFVGPSGSGKSTILALLMRLYDPTQGEILVDGQPLRDYDLRFLRRDVMSIVPQDPTLFSGTVLENVAYGLRRDDDDSEALQSGEDKIMGRVRTALSDANALDFVERHTDGLQAAVGARGDLLSGGQKQRVAIARALVMRPRVLLMDEATSSLDSESEQLVQSAIARLMKAHQQSAIIVAHRLSTVLGADRIFVLDQGALSESGSYAELMARPEGLFHKMMERQLFRSDSAPPPPPVTPDVTGA